MRIAISSIVLVAILGCNFTEPQENLKLETFEQLKQRALSKYAHVTAEIRSFLSQVPKCTPEPVIGNNWCDYAEIGFTPAPRSPTSQGQRILIIDRGMQLAGYTRYRSRLIESLEPDSDGHYARATLTFLLSNGRRHILDTLLNERFPETPALALQELVREESAVFPASIYTRGHGDRILATLADLNPQAQFVIAQSRMYPVERLAEIEDEEEFLQVLGHYLDNLSSSLITNIQKYDINYVNMSFGDTVATLELWFNGKIKAHLSNQQFYRRVLKLTKERFYDRLFSLRHVIFVQSAVWADYFIETSDEDFLTDCAEYPNRIRAGSIEMVSTDIPKEGTRRDAYIADQGARKCADVFANSGVEVVEVDHELIPTLGEFPYLSNFDGIGVAFLDEYFSSSWAAPLILSHLIYRKNEAATRGETLSIDYLRNSQIIFEPIKYRQLEIFRLGVL